MSISKYTLPILTAVLLTLFFMGLPALKKCRLQRTESEYMASRKIQRGEAAVLAAITLVYAAVAFWKLGNTKSPQSFYDMENRIATFTFSEPVNPSAVMFYTGVGIGDYEIGYSQDGENFIYACGFEQTHVEVLKWNKIPWELEEPVRYIRILGRGGVYLGEVCFLDYVGNVIPIKCDVWQLRDEQELCQQKETFMNSTYFDEIYHARTAWENLHNVDPYECSHPPLGKLIISVGIALFGMTPFGWRFSGTLFGVLMLPIMYVFCKKLFGGRAVPTACTVVFAAGFMHFVQTRIATIDTYSVFFIMLMYLFMYLFITEEKLKYLALSGLFFGIGAASKWTSIYAGIGLAVIWAIYWVTHREKDFMAFLKNSLLCVVFFVLIPAAIYYVSYYPYATARGWYGPGELFSGRYAKMVWDNQKFMFSYHSGLVAEHPYASRWYQWMLDIRPILYYLEYFEDGTRSSFGAFVNPAVCWGGLLALFVLYYTCLARMDKLSGFILIGYLSQLLPWVTINRLTFEYHYFPCTVFLILALGYVFNLMELNVKRWRWYVWGFVTLSVGLFVLFYPALSGMRVDGTAASRLLGWLPTWPF